MSSAAVISQLLATKQILTYIKKSFLELIDAHHLLRAEKFYLENEARQNILLKYRTVWNYFV